MGWVRFVSGVRMPVNTRGVSGRIHNDGIMAEAKYGGDSERAIAQGILSTEALIVDRLLGVNAQVRQDLLLSEKSGVPKGTCMDCKEPISAKRLEALPYAVRCVHCQELADPPSTRRR